VGRRPTATLAVLYGWIGWDGHGLDRILALAGALLILAALAVARRSRLAAAALLAAALTVLVITGLVLTDVAAVIAGDVALRRAVPAWCLRAARLPTATGPGVSQPPPPAYAAAPVLVVSRTV
jgi:hypothetical protein